MLGLSAETGTVVAAIAVSAVCAMFFTLLCAFCKKSSDDGQPQLKGMSQKHDHALESGLVSNNNTHFRFHEAAEFNSVRASKATTMNRKLPEIPVNGSLAPGQLAAPPTYEDTGSDLYETLGNCLNNGSLSELTNGIAGTNTNTFDSSKTYSLVDRKRDEFREMSPASSNHSETDYSSQKDDAPLRKEHHSYAKVKRKNSGSAFNSAQNGKVKVENVYAVIQGQASEERDTDTDNYDEPQMLTKNKSWTMLETPPPVPEKNFDPSEFLPSTSHSVSASRTSVQPIDLVDAGPSTSSAALSRSNLHLENLAASAVAGHLSSAEIPYMTSPLRTPDGDRGPLADESQNSSAGSVIGRCRYTSISVREPLANLMAQATSRLLDQRPEDEPIHGTITRRQTENVYAILSDDEQNMYAEIGSGPHSATSSVTYARVTEPSYGVSVPPVHEAIGEERAVSRQGSHTDEQAPEPPTVQSLLTTAMQHQRHSSSLSLALPLHHDSSNHVSPRCSDPTMMTPTGRQSVTSGSSLQTPLSESDQPNLNEMYAKVHKGHRQRASATASTSSHGSEFAYTRLEDAEKSEVEAAVDRSQCEDKALVSESNEFGYELIVETRQPRQRLASDITTDPGYEMVPPAARSTTVYVDPNYERLAGDYDEDSMGYEVVSRKPGRTSRASDVESDPTYELLNDARRLPPPAAVAEEDQVDESASAFYESVRQPPAIDPGYETVLRKDGSRESRRRGSCSDDSDYYERIVDRRPSAAAGPKE